MPTVFTDMFKENYKVLESLHIKVGYLFGKFMVNVDFLERGI